MAGQCAVFLRPLDDRDERQSVVVEVEGSRGVGLRPQAGEAKGASRTASSSPFPHQITTSPPTGKVAAAEEARLALEREAAAEQDREAAAEQVLERERDELIGRAPPLCADARVDREPVAVWPSSSDPRATLVAHNHPLAPARRGWRLTADSAHPNARTPAVKPAHRLVPHVVDKQIRQPSRGEPKRSVHDAPLQIREYRPIAFTAR